VLTGHNGAASTAPTFGAETLMNQLSGYKYADFLADLRLGRYYGVFIDDTGSPGLVHPSQRLHPERKSWVAVLIRPRDSVEVLQQMPGAIEELRRATGAKEFHFADIYAGRKVFRGMEVSLRLAFFRFMAHIFATYNFPVIVQTFDPQSLNSIHEMMRIPKRLGPFNFHKPADLALFFLLIRAKWFLQQENTNDGPWARVFVDEGFQKNGAAIKIPAFQQCYVDGLVCFARSDMVIPIQLADFAAFSLNKTQLILGKQEKTDLDWEILEILSPISWNYIDLPKTVATGRYDAGSNTFQ
jgi:hypothetical protein